MTSLQSSMLIADDPLAFSVQARKMAVGCLRSHNLMAAARLLATFIDLPKRSHRRQPDQPALFPHFDRALRLFGRPGCSTPDTSTSNDQASNNPT